MRSGNALAEHRRALRLNGNDLDIRVLGFQILAHAGNRTARADTCHEDIHLAVRVVPDLHAGGLLVNCRVCGVGELGRDEAVRDLSRELLRLGDGTLHALCALGEDELSTVSLHEIAALHAHGLGHGNDKPIAAGCGNCRQTDAGIAGGRLNDNAALLEQTLRLCVLDHCLGDPVLDRTGGIEILQLAKHGRAELMGLFESLQFEQRGIADEVGKAGNDICHNKKLLSG